MPKSKLRKKWSKPELTVLLRANSEERVLSGCKINGEGGPGSSDGGCQNLDDWGGYCMGPCAEDGPS